MNEERQVRHQDDWSRVSAFLYIIFQGITRRTAQAEFMLEARRKFSRISVWRIENSSTLVHVNLDDLAVGFVWYPSTESSYRNEILRFLQYK